MRGQVSPFSSGSIDYYGKGQVGIIDSNNNGILDVLEAKPSVDLVTSSGIIGTDKPKIEGSANVNARNNSNPSGLGNDITISVIDEVQYRVNNGGWVKASASDGRFDEAEEDFHFTPTLSKGGYYKIEVQSKDNAGNWGDIKEISLTIGEGRIITMPGYTGGPQIREFSQQGSVLFDSFFAFPSFMRNGGRVATGDIDKDHKDEIIVGSGMGARPHVVVYEKNGEKRGIDFRPFDMNFTGGVDVAGADIDGNGKDEIVMSQFTKGNLVKVYKYNESRELIAAFRPFGNVNCGVTVTAGDIDYDGKDEVIVAASLGGGPHVRFFDIKAGEAIPKPMSYFVFHPNSRTGLDISAGDIDGDGKDEFAVSQLFNDEAWVKVYRYNGEHTIVGEWLAFPQGVKSGANVDMFDFDNDGKDEVLVGPNLGGGPQVRGFEATGEITSLNFFAYASYFRGGVNPVGGFF